MASLSTAKITLTIEKPDFDNDEDSDLYDQELEKFLEALEISMRETEELENVKRLSPPNNTLEPERKEKGSGYLPGIEAEIDITDLETWWKSVKECVPSKFRLKVKIKLPDGREQTLDGNYSQSELSAFVQSLKNPSIVS